MMNFSVLISVYYKEKAAHLKAALQSLVDQTMMPNEIVLVKDGPLGAELETIINSFLETYPSLFRIIEIPTNKGLGTALSHGLAKCTNELVARMDTDDICIPRRFEKQIKFMESHPEVDVLGSNVEEFNEVPGDLKSFRIMPESGRKLRNYAKFRSPVNHPSIMFRKSKVLVSGGYNGDILLFEDYSLFIRMILNNCVFYNLQEILLYFRIGTGIATIKRRSGWSYVKSEIRFVNYANQIGYYSMFDRLIYLVTKIPLRFLPPRIVLFIYTTLLRRKSIK